MISKNLKTHAIRNNYLANLCNGEIIFPINDDMIFVSDKWDDQIDNEFHDCWMTDSVMPISLTTT